MWPEAKATAWPILTEGSLPRQSLLLGKKGGPGLSCFPEKEHLLGWVVEVLGVGVVAWVRPGCFTHWE